jgi:hypothetical protein
MPHTRSILVLALGAAALAGCGNKGAGRAGDVLPADFVSWDPDRESFQPARIRIHPLTRITREAGGAGKDGAEVLICHVELRDRFDQVVKCLGLVQVELVAADAQGRPRSESAAPERVWQVDLRDPSHNAAAFDDIVTRTYALHLGALPPALARLADTPDLGKDSPDRPLYALRVRFLFKDTAGESRQLDTMAPLFMP